MKMTLCVCVWLVCVCVRVYAGAELKCFFFLSYIDQIENDCQE